MVARETSLRSALKELRLESDDASVSRLLRLVSLLETDAIEQGLIGPNEGPRVLSRHVLESASLMPHLCLDGPVLDVGAGAGLPGLVLACLGRQVVLVDSQARRVAFMRAVSDELGLETVVERGRAEDLARGALRGSLSTVVARALAEIPTAMELCLPFVRPGGRFVYPSTPPSDRSPTDLASVADQLGGDVPSWGRLAVPGAGEPRWVMIVEKIRPTPDRFPRRAGLPKWRPLG